MTEVLSHCAGADVHRHVKALDEVKKHEQAIKNSNERENRIKGIKSSVAVVRVMNCAFGWCIMMAPRPGKSQISRGQYDIRSSETPLISAPLAYDAP
jgi:hypothetical protein